MMGPLDATTKVKVYPLTEENLAIHTQSFPPCKDARRRHARLFVENQRPVIEMELILEEQRAKEISSYIPISIDDVNNKINFHDPFNEQQHQEHSKKKKNWFNRLTHWIRLDNNGNNKKEKRRHRSWSAGITTEKEEREHHTEDNNTIQCQQQKRDSGISIFNKSNSTGKRRSSSIARSTTKIVSIPIVRQPKLSPSPKQQMWQQPKTQQQQNDELIAFKYPKMVQKIAGQAITNPFDCGEKLNSPPIHHHHQNPTSTYCIITTT